MSRPFLESTLNQSDLDEVKAQTKDSHIGTKMTRGRLLDRTYMRTGDFMEFVVETDLSGGTSLQLVVPIVQDSLLHCGRFDVPFIVYPAR